MSHDPGLNRPVDVATAGLGGYAGSILKLLLQHPQYVRVRAVCDPNLAAHGDLVADLRANGVGIHESLDAMLASLPETVRGVWLPVPIQLHRPFTEQVLAAGRNVMVEKPVAGCVQDLDAMVSAEHRSSHSVHVGYQHIYDPDTLWLKKQLLGGAIGDLREVRVLGMWPRGSAYYGRNNWAGALRRGDTWVLDSPANNALAHMVNLALYFLGDETSTWADPHTVEAELYRVNDIENFDTCALRIKCTNGRTLLVYMTHACENTVGPVLTFTGTDGTGEWGGNTIRLSPTASPVQERPLDFGRRDTMVRSWAEILCDRQPQTEVATLTSSRKQLVVINAAAEASAVRTIDPAYVRVVNVSEQDRIRAVVGMENVLTRCRDAGKLPNELGDVPWSHPAGSKDARNYTHFPGPKTA